ncbi:unnamed protein product [Caretta caretta]
MDEFYKISSTERVQQLEKELAAQLAELKTEIEDNGVLQGTPDRSYSLCSDTKGRFVFQKRKGGDTKERFTAVLNSVRKDEMPKYLKISNGMKDRGYNRDPQQCRVKLKELRQADQRTREANGHSRSEPQTCRLYDELHALLGGVPTTTPVLRMDSINGLSHNRDADFGDEEDEEEEVEAQQASGETIFPDSQELFFTPDLVPSQPTEGRLLDLEGGEGSSGKQIGPIMQEYNDAVQRATRLSAARQNFLTGKKNPVNIVTQEDLVIYMQWLVCHLHSLKAIHSYLRVLQYLPISRRMEVVIEKHPEVAQDNGDRFRSATMSESLSSNIHFSLCPSISGREGPLGKDDVFTLPQHTTETEELKPQLHLLLSYFGVCYDTENLKNSANEMELFSEVIRKFRSVFSKQQTMRTFPVYDAGVPGSENWGILGPSMVLKKRANWIPFIKIKPKQDPWQQKLLTKLKQWKKVDELLHLQSKFLEVSDMEQVIDVLQEHATEVL